MSVPPFDLTDDELKAQIRAASHVNYFVAGWQRELDSRHSARTSERANRIAIAAAVAAVAAAIAGVLALLR
jgi:hypothetical protein